MVVALNGEQVGEWTGDRNAISNTSKEGFPHDRRVSLWIHPGGNEFTFHRIRIRMLDGGVVDTLRAVFKSAPPAAEPLIEADIKRIAALPVADQVEEVRKELKKRNPTFEGTVTPTIENDVVTGIEFFTNQVSDLKPLNEMPLTDLHTDNSQVADLSPLKGMPVTQIYLDFQTKRDTEFHQAMRSALVKINDKPAAEFW